MLELNQRNEIKKLKEQEEAFQVAYLQLNLTVDNSIRQEVDEYKNRSVIGRWWYRATSDSDILAKVTAVAYDDAISKIKQMQSQVSNVITATKTIIFSDPSNESSSIPEYTVRELSTLAPNTINAKDETLLFIANGKSYLENVFQKAAELSKVSFFADKTYDDILERHKNEAATLLDKVAVSVMNLFTPWVEKVRRVVNIRMLNPNYQNNVTGNLKRIVSEDSVEGTQKTAEEINDELSKLTNDQKQQFEEKYPHYKDAVTLEILVDPVTWSGDDKVYERSSIKEWINSRLSDSVSVVRSPLTGTNVSLLQEENTKLKSNKELQAEILSNLKTFVNELQPIESTSLSSMMS